MRNKRLRCRVVRAPTFTTEIPIFKPWFNLAMLAAELQQVMWLRLIKLSAGGTNAYNEARLMTSEKVVAATQAAGS